MKVNKNKWVVGATSAALVASAIVPVASAANFSDIEKNDHKDAILALAEAGIVSGYTDGTFKPNAVVTRGNVTKLLGKWLVSEGYKVPENFETEGRFTDLPVTSADQELVKYAALVKDEGVFKGSNDKLMQANNMTREQMAVVLVRAIKTVYGVDLVADYKVANFESKITDLEKATADENREAITALEFAELTTVTAFNPKNSLTRGQFASFLHRAITNVAPAELTVKTVTVKDATTLDVTLSDDSVHTVTLEKALPANEETKVEFVIDGKTYSATVTYEVNELKLESVTANTAKSLKVTFNIAVDDTKKALFEVKKGSVKANVSKITWNEAKTEATIELASKLTAGEYAVAISGLSENAFTGSITAENETVSAIEITSDLAVKSTTTATVGYKVTNQYGEDITKTTALNVNVAGLIANATPNATANKGEVTFDLTSGAKEGETAVVTLVHTTTGKSATKTVKLSSEAVIDTVKVAGVYNKDGKTLNETTKLGTDAFYLVVEGKDQYGKDASVALLNNLLVNNTNSTIVGVSKTFETLTIEGVTKTVLKLTGTPKAGTTNVMFISPSTGKSTTFAIEVAEAQRTDVVTFDVPSLVVAGEDLFIPITVTDKAGKEVTDIDVIKDANRGIKVTGTTNTIEKNKDGVIGVKVAKGNLPADYLSLVALSSTAKSQILNVQVKAAAVPTVITGLSKTASKVITGATHNVAAADLVVEDQYGRVMSADTTPLTLANIGATEGYRVVLADTDSNVITITAAELYANQAAELTKGTNGSEKIEFKLQKYDTATASWKDVANSSQEITYEVTDGTEFVSYEVKEIGTILDEVAATFANDSAYDKKIEVYGVLASGNKVRLDSTKYSLEAPTYLDVTADGAYQKFALNTAKEASEDTAKVVPYEDKATSAEATVKVVINATGQLFEQKVTVSKVAPKAAQVKLVDTTTTSVTSETFASLQEKSAIAITANTAVANTLVDIAVIDTYGVAHLIEAGSSTYFAPKFIGTPEVANTVTLTNQNAAGLTIAGFDKGEKVTVKINVDGIEKSFSLTTSYDAVAAAEAEAESAVANEVSKYEKTATVVNTVKVNEDITATVVKLKDQQTANNTVTVSYSVANDAKYLTVEDGKVKLKAQPTNVATDNTENLTITFTKNGKVATATVAVTVTPQD